MSDWDNRKSEFSWIISRRAFLRASGFALGAAALGGCSDGTGPDAGDLPPGSPKRVAIIGAGLAGLVAGFELTALGHDVTILEARPRVGGRVLTLRTAFADGQFAEAGAARIPPSHDLTLGYAARFGLPVDPFYPPTGLYVDQAGGTRRMVDADAFRSARPSYVKIRGGSERLPIAFAEALGSRIRLATPVTSVEQRGSAVTLRGEGNWSLIADRVLCTVPLPVLFRVRFTPELSGLKRTAQLASYGASIRQPEGHVHFAGEHISDDRGWMQGALASGLRAVAEIHEA